MTSAGSFWRPIHPICWCWAGPESSGTILDVPLIATVNAYRGLLPTLRGSSSVGWALYKDLPQGATTHFVDTHIDEGDIILRRNCRFIVGTPTKINGRVATLAGKLMAETLGCFERGAVLRSPQDRTEGETFAVISEDLLAEGKRRLADGTYSHFSAA